MVIVLSVVVLGLSVAGGWYLRGEGRDGASAAATASSGPTADGEPGTPLVASTVEAPATDVGLPAPERVRITSIGVDATLERLDVDPAGRLKAPVDPDDAGWFAGGTSPGDMGPAVIAGHVDSHDGPAVFYRLRELRAGDTVEVRRGDRWFAFTVVATEQFPKTEFRTDKVYGPTPVPELRLVTCGGPFDRDRRSYQDNVVVYAVAA